VIWKPNQIFEKSEKKGRDPAREIAPSLFCNINPDIVNIAFLRSYRLVILSRESQRHFLRRN